MYNTVHGLTATRLHDQKSGTTKGRKSLAKADYKPQVSTVFDFTSILNRLVDELLQSAAVNVCNGSKCYVSNELACAYQNPASVMKLRAAKEIQIDVCREVLKTQQIFPIERVDRHVPFQRLRKLRVASRDEGTEPLYNFLLRLRKF